MILFVVRRECVKFESRSEKSVNVRVANASYNYKPNVCVSKMDEPKASAIYNRRQSITNNWGNKPKTLFN